MTQGEKKEIRRVLAKLQQRGWSLSSVGDGEERIPTPSFDAVIEVVSGVDESWIYITPPNETKKHTLYIVLGNEPDGSEVIADCSFHPDIEWACEASFACFRMNRVFSDET